mmetsp:Transcript_2416/g.4268  ORF Transcript_2416/g.4268 Transcript_2416/m.4268 type:complete len:246 (-) Transcript_2416:875-1612(-)
MRPDDARRRRRLRRRPRRQLSRRLVLVAVWIWRRESARCPRNSPPPLLLQKRSPALPPPSPPPRVSRRRLPPPLSPRAASTTVSYRARGQARVCRTQRASVRRRRASVGEGYRHDSAVWYTRDRLCQVGTEGRRRGAVTRGRPALGRHTATYCNDLGGYRCQEAGRGDSAAGFLAGRSRTVGAGWARPCRRAAPPTGHCHREEGLGAEVSAPLTVRPVGSLTHPVRGSRHSSEPSVKPPPLYVAP